MPSSSTISKMAKFAALTCRPLCLPLWLSACLVMWSLAVIGQTQPSPPATSAVQKGQDQSDVLRVYTELVQTDVMVFDKQGHFVNGLKREDFELRIDGKPKPLEFFEKITAGSIDEESQLAAARGSSARTVPGQPARAIPLDRGRPIFFYVDDLHLNLPSAQMARKLIENFIEKEMGQNDEVAIASASGQIGFLQQLTDNKAVLRAALERLKVRSASLRDAERPTMSEYQALLITNYDRDVTDYFIEETMRLFPGLTREAAESLVLTRARTLAQQSGRVTVDTLSGLEDLIRKANSLPGRKLIFFVSGGFFLDDRNSDSKERLQRITSAAARSGVVIYSLDARGLVAGLTDASTDSNFDLTGRILRANSGELSASQDGMNALAADTGGKAVFNTNRLEPGLGRALKETSTYYLLAWKPEREPQAASKFRRVEVKVVGKPNLTVQVRRGFFDREPEPSVAKAAKQKQGDTRDHSDKSDDAVKQPGKQVVKSPETELRKVINEAYPVRDIPVSLNLSYLNTPRKGPLLSAALQVPNEFFSFDTVDGKQKAVVTVAGIVLDDRGNVGAVFDNRVTIEATSIEAAREGPGLKYGYPVYLGPGLYQVRVGVRDDKTGRAGTAHDWIEIPRLSQGELALSSLLIGLRTSPGTSNAAPSEADVPEAVELSVTHSFSANGYLRFVLFVYNAAFAPADSKPDVAVQVQIVRDEQPVVTTPLKKISTEGIPDLARLPYAAEVSLNGLPAGRYVLQVTVVDRVAKRSASQRTRFDIE